HRARVEGVALLAAAQLLFAVGFVGGLLLVVRGAVDGHHSVGDVVLVVTLAVQTNSIVFESVFLTQWLQRSVRAVTRLRWLRELVAALYPPAPTDEPVPETIHRGIRLERVSFR